MRKEIKMAVLTMRSEEFNTFPPVLKDYAHHLVAIRGISEKTVCEYLLDLRSFFRFLKAKRIGAELDTLEIEKISILDVNVATIKSVTREDIVEFLVHATLDRGNNTTTRMRKLSSIRSFFHYAHSRQHYIENNPSDDVDSPKKSKTLPKYLTIAEAIKLLEAIKGDKTSKTVIRDFAIVTLFLNTGMRLSELVGLNLNSFDHDLAKVKVIGKGRKERIVYLNDAAKRALIDYLKIRLDPRYITTSDKAFFLSRRQVRISNKTIQWMVAKYLDMAGLGDRGLSVHKLRHTAATLMYQSGRVDIRVLKDILGHEQLNTTQIYTHVVDRNIEEAVSNHPLADIDIKAPDFEED